MAYQVIDPIIKAWAKRHGFTLFDRVEGTDKPFRCAYLSSDGGECFQIWVDEPNGDKVAVHAGDVETKNDEEMQHDWSVPLGQLESTLDAAVAHVRAWMVR